MSDPHYQELNMRLGKVDGRNLIRDGVTQLKLVNGRGLPVMLLRVVGENVYVGILVRGELGRRSATYQLGMISLIRLLGQEPITHTTTFRHLLLIYVQRTIGLQVRETREWSDVQQYVGSSGGTIPGEE